MKIQDLKDGLKQTDKEIADAKKVRNKFSLMIKESEKKRKTLFLWIQSLEKLGMIDDDGNILDENGNIIEGEIDGKE